MYFLREDKVDVDPFDTTFAQNILPGKEELKLIEKEILKNDITFDPRGPEVSKLENRVSGMLSFNCQICNDIQCYNFRINAQPY